MVSALTPAGEVLRDIISHPATLQSLGCSSVANMLEIAIKRRIHPAIVIPLVATGCYMLNPDFVHASTVGVVTGLAQMCGTGHYLNRATFNSVSWLGRSAASVRLA